MDGANGGPVRYTEADLRAWAEAHAPAGMPQAAMVLELLEDRDRFRRAFNNVRKAACDLVKGHCREEGRLRDMNRALAERVAAQAELLVRAAESQALRG